MRNGCLSAHRHPGSLVMNAVKLKMRQYNDMMWFVISHRANIAFGSDALSRTLSQSAFTARILSARTPKTHRRVRPDCCLDTDFRSLRAFEINRPLSSSSLPIAQYSGQFSHYENYSFFDDCGHFSVRFQQIERFWSSRCQINNKVHVKNPFKIGK